VRLGRQAFNGPGRRQLRRQVDPDGDITFVPEDKTLPREGAKIKDGKYELKAKEGKYRVEIRATREVPGRKGPMGEPAIEEYIPGMYNSNSSLTAEVASGKTTHDFPLKTGP
jgi:hypothetical protein